MNFVHLPHELKESIVQDLAESTLASLCLVSKSISSLVLPLLYRKIWFRVVKWKSIEDWVIEAGVNGLALGDAHSICIKIASSLNAAVKLEQEKKRLQTAFSNSLEHHRDLQLLITELKVEICREWEGEEQARELVKLLTSIRNLEKLSIWTMEPKGIGAESSNSIFHHVPSFITSLDLSSFPVPASPLLKLLLRLPLLESLSLASDGGAGTFVLSPADPSPHLPQLKQVSLLSLFCSEPLLSRILSNNRSLSRLAIDFPALKAVKYQDISSLLHLTIKGVMNTKYDCSRDDFFARDLISILRNCQSLESFEFVTEDSKYLKVATRQVTKPQILRHLPLTVRRIHLASAIFGAESILEFMESRPQSNLRLVELSRFGPGGCTFDPMSSVSEQIWEEIGQDGFGLDGEARIEELGKKSNISVRWISEKD